MKVLFLDIDGVLNSLESTMMAGPRKRLVGDHVDPMLIRRLNKICEEVPDLKIVISSSWRKIYSIEEILEVFLKAGFNVKTEIIDRTPGHVEGTDGKRGHEIEAWYKAHPEVTNYVILDDDSDMLRNQRRHFVNTSWVCGLTFADVYRCVKILNPLSEFVKQIGSHVEFSKNGGLDWKVDKVEEL